MNRILTVTLLLVLMDGCAVQEAPTHFYALSSMLPPQPREAHRLPVKVGVGPLDFPRTLQRPQVVTRENDNKINVADFHQWGGRLDDDFLRVLADNLVVLLGSSQIYAYPWESRLRPDYQVRISVSRFDGELGGDVTLRARWQLMSRQQRRELTARQSLIVEPVEGNDYAAYVAAQSRALAKLSREIAEQIRYFARQESESDQKIVPDSSAPKFRGDAKRV